MARSEKQAKARKGWVIYRAENNCGEYPAAFRQGELLALEAGAPQPDGFTRIGKTAANRYEACLLKGQPIIRVDGKPATKADTDFRGIPLVAPYDMHSHLFRVSRLSVCRSYRDGKLLYPVPSLEHGRKIPFVDLSDDFYYLALRIEAFNTGKPIRSSIGRDIWMIREFAEFRALGGAPSGFWPYLRRGFPSQWVGYNFGSVNLPGPPVINENLRTDDILQQHDFPKKAELGKTTDPDIIDRFCSWYDALLDGLDNKGAFHSVILHLGKVLRCGKSVATALHMLRIEFIGQHPAPYQKSARGRKPPKRRRLPL